MLTALSKETNILSDLFDKYQKNRFLMIFHSQECENKHGDKWESIQPYDFKTVADFETDYNGKFSLKQKETKKINLTNLTGACSFDKSNVYRVFFRPIVVCNTLFEGDNDLTIFEFNFTDSNAEYVHDQIRTLLINKVTFIYSVQIVKVFNPIPDEDLINLFSSDRLPKNKPKKRTQPKSVEPVELVEEPEEPEEPVEQEEPVEPEEPKNP